MTTLELLPYQIARGPHNMAADETMLERAATGRALLRFYAWTTATVSLGYFQSHKLREQDPLLTPLPFVRRPTGGATLVHHHELTYAFALPTNLAGPNAQSWLDQAHKIIAQALTSLGVLTQTPLSPPGERGRGEGASDLCTLTSDPCSERGRGEGASGLCTLTSDFRSERGRGEGVRSTTHHSPLTTHDSLCFHCHASVDLLIGPNKVLGSAQRKQRGALMQHGSILLAQSPHTPSLPGIFELTGKTIGPEELADRIAHEWTTSTGWHIKHIDRSPQEQDRLRELAQTKYDDPSWNCKR